MSDRIQSEWFAATLEDALETLEEFVFFAKIPARPRAFSSTK